MMNAPAPFFKGISNTNVLLRQEERLLALKDEWCTPQSKGAAEIYERFITRMEWKC